MNNCSRCGNKFRKNEKPFALYELTEEYKDGFLIKIWRTDLCSKCDKEIFKQTQLIRHSYPHSIWKEEKDGLY